MHDLKKIPMVSPLVDRLDFEVLKQRSKTFRSQRNIKASISLKQRGFL